MEQKSRFGTSMCHYSRRLVVEKLSDFHVVGDMNEAVGLGVELEARKGYTIQKSMALVAGGNALIDSQFVLKERLGITYGSTVGDFGCGGAGYFVFAASKLVGPGGLVYAVDVQRLVLDNIESRKTLGHIQNIKTIWSNLEIFGGTPMNNSCCDYAIVVNVLFQNTKQHDLLREVSRMLKPNGKMLIVDWNEGRLFIGPKSKEKISAIEVGEVAASVGLKEKERFSAGKWHYGIIFEK